MSASPEAAEHVNATRALAAYAAGLSFDGLPANVVELAKACLTDAVACAIYGSTKPWSRIVVDYVEGMGASGPSFLPGALEHPLPPAQAALCLGAFSHAFELDNLRKPGAGVHPGATVALPAMMVAQAVGASGRELIAAIVAGCEVMFRIGKASLHTPEAIGFHAPGITGPFGAAASAGRLLGLDTQQMTYAFGICASMSGGILKFARSGQGGMVKRLHLGRAAEAGVTAAMLAAKGFEAPAVALEGPFGVLDVFCNNSDGALLTKGLGEVFEIETLCIKRYACHVTAQAPIQVLRELMAQHGFLGEDIEDLSLAVSDKVLSHHAETRPNDLMLAQYSVPFSLAVAAFRDPENPSSFSDDILTDSRITGLARVTELSASGAKGWGTTLSLRLRDGRQISGSAEGFLGCPDTPFSIEDLKEKFHRLTAGFDTSRMLDLRDWLLNMDYAERVRTTASHGNSRRSSFSWSA
jgi:2-methylcitrate dehydratase PrpD